MNLMESYKADIRSLENIIEEYEISIGKAKAKPKTKESLANIKELESLITNKEDEIELTELRIELEEVKGGKINE